MVEKNQNEQFEDEISSTGDIVSEIQGIIMRDIPFTSSYWAEDIAIALLSTVSSNLYFSTKIGRVPTNVWFMAIAQSARGHKSPPINNFLRPIIKQMEIDSGNFNWKLSSPSSFSLEGMTEYLVKNSKGIIINDEMSQLFKAAQGKGYTINLMEFLDKLFDGIVEPRYTRQFKLEEIPSSAYLSLLGATTPVIYRVLDYDSFVSGFGTRFLYELWEPSQEITYSKENLMTIGGETDRIEIYKKYARILSRIFSKEIIKTEPTTGAISAFVKYRQELNDRAIIEEKRKNQDIANYIEKVSIYLFKLASLFALSRQISIVAGSSLKEMSIELCEEDVDRAYKKVIRHIDNFQKVMSSWSYYRNSKPVLINDYSPYKDSILVFLQQAGGIMTVRELAIKLGWVDKNSSKGITEKYNQILNNAIKEKNLKLYESEEVKLFPQELLDRLEIVTVDKNGNAKKKLPFVISTKEFKLSVS